MAIVSFTLNEDAVAALRDALVCLNKFSDDVSFEAQKDKVFFVGSSFHSRSAYPVSR
jgi:cell cycle checkpoint control protein RAD9A